MMDGQLTDSRTGVLSINLGQLHSAPGTDPAKVGGTSAELDCRYEPGPVSATANDVTTQPIFSPAPLKRSNSEHEGLELINSGRQFVRNISSVFNQIPGASFFRLRERDDFLAPL